MRPSHAPVLWVLLWIGGVHGGRTGTCDPLNKNDREPIVPTPTGPNKQDPAAQWPQWRWVWWKTEEESAKSAPAGGDELSVELQILHEAEEHKHSVARNKKKRPKNGKQKMANCRHLAMVNSTKSSSRLTRLWKTTKRALRNYLERTVSTATMTSSVTTSSSSTTKMEDFSSSRDMNMAYGMSVMAALAYWPFHKKAIPNNRSSFDLLTLKDGTPKPLLRRRKRDKALGMVLSGVRVALDQAQPWLSLLPKNKQTRQRVERNTSYYRETIKNHLEERISRQQRYHIQLEYVLYNWYEPTPLGNYHDTDLIVATSNNGRTLIIAFAGTASVPDTVTNLQTFEPVTHSGLFNSHANHTTTSTLEGSIHRGFLNAYSRVERGSVLRLCDDSNCTRALKALHRYSHCTADTSHSEAPIPSHKDFDQYDVEADQKSRTDAAIMANNDNATATTTITDPPAKQQQEESIVRKKGRRGCKVKNRKLMDALRELTVEYLSTPGRSVLLSGHSLGGSLATLHALDIIINFPNVPVTNLELWTYGGAQVSDNAFLKSALLEAPRLRHFIQEQTITANPMGGLGNSQKEGSRFHRFVTVSDDCKVDFVSTVAQNLLAPRNERNIHGKTARKLGGVLGGKVVHLTEPHYLLTPDQYDLPDEDDDDDHDGTSDAKRDKTTSKSQDYKENRKTNDNNKKAATVPADKQQPSSTRSTLAAHSTANYLKGISRESKDHPLSTDLPGDVRSFMGETSWPTEDDTP